MQPDPDTLPISADARAFICRQRPELADACGPGGIDVRRLLQTTANPPPAQFEGRANPALLGNRLRSALQRIGVAYLVHRLMRGRDCGCAGRAAWLNRNSLRIELCLWALAYWLFLIGLIK